MTVHQRSTVEYFKGIAKENGSTLEVEFDGGLVWVTETKSAEWDNERNQWIVYTNGKADLL